jgi:hypothetical protein
MPGATACSAVSPAPVEPIDVEADLKIRSAGSGGAGLAVLLTAVAAGLAFAAEGERQQRFEEMSRRAEERGLAEPYRGIAANGELVHGLFGVESTGVSTAPVVDAARTFLDNLTPERRQQARFPVEDPEWRKWMNQHFYVRQGVSFETMTEDQRTAALDLMKTSLSAKGMQLSRDIMRLNHTLGELNGDNFEEYGEWLYWITVMGEPSATEPWGWQLDGHHLVINYFVLGDQVVMTPLFVGSEPARAEAGKYAGTAILEAERSKGLELLRSLNEAQRQMAVIRMSKDGNDNLAEAFRDNVDLEYAGIPASLMSTGQRQALLDLAGLYVGNLRDGHAAVRMAEVERHLDDTYFAWIGGDRDEDVFYYRVFSPVILIEFDHQEPANLRHLHPPLPNRQHIHALIRTPNGNDYGKDLLRQHYLQHPH